VRPSIELGFIVAWLLLRATGDDPTIDAAWTAAAVVVAALSPVSGLVILVGVAPWDQPLTLGNALGLRHLLVLGLAASAGLRVLFRPRSLPRTQPVAVAFALLAITLILGVGWMYAEFGRKIGWESATFWLAGFGGAMIVLLVATWLGYGGQSRPLWAAVVVATVAGALSLADYVLPGVMRGLPVQALLADKTFGTRLAGAIASPNAMVSLLVTPAAVFAAALVLGRDRRIRVAAAVLLAGLAAAMLLTYSRSAILALFAIAVLVLWRWRRKVGAALLLGGLAVGIAIAPAYLQARGSVLGGSSAVVPGKILIATDEQRITAWSAASRMFLDRPLTGQGFRSYKKLAPVYGDAVLGSPHNEWLRLFAEEGIVAGILGLAFVLTIARDLARAPGWLAVGCLGAFIGWAITATFNNPFLFLQVNAIAFTVAGVMLGLGRRAADQPDAPPVPLPIPVGAAS
jgi:O-antigen ligase